MSVIAITGTKSGIGAATVARLRERGHRIISIDVAGADITADLSRAEGRAGAVAAVLERCGGVLDGLILCAGVGPVVKPPSLVAAVNYFGSVALLDGLRDALARGSSPAAVVVSSVASVQVTWEKNPIGQALDRVVQRQARRQIGIAKAYEGE